MAAQQLNPNEKKVELLQVVEDLRSGLTRWKKDDIGFGSLEKKYNLTLPEAVELFNHPKIRNIETKIPTFIIIDNLPDEGESRVELVEEEFEYKGLPQVSQTQIYVSIPKETRIQPSEKLEAFI